MKSRILHRRIIILVLSTLVIIPLSCTKEASGEMFIVFFTGDVRLQRTGSEVPVQAGGEVRQDDFFTVGERSALVIQGGNDLTVRLEAGTEAVISSLDINDRQISLQKGKVLSRIEKLKKGYGYSVKTPTILASVRGTSFLTEYTESRSIVAVAQGAVSVKSMTGSSGEIVVPEGKSAVPDRQGALELKPMNDVEKLELEKLGKTPLVNAVYDKKPAELKEIFRETEQIDKEINEKIEKARGLSVAELREKYGRIDTITLYSGRVIKGVIISRGTNYTIQTSSGMVTVRARDVKRTD